MVPLSVIDTLERRYTEGGEPTLGGAPALLRQRWRARSRDRESALRLLFLAWYSSSEPPFLTGLPGDDGSPALFREVFSALGGESSADAELLFVAGYMMSLFPWCVGPEEEWRRVGERCLARWRQLSSSGIGPEVFEGRGAYGHYFAHIVRSGWGRAEPGAAADRAASG